MLLLSLAQIWSLLAWVRWCSNHSSAQGPLQIGTVWPSEKSPEPYSIRAEEPKPPMEAGPWNLLKVGESNPKGAEEDPCGRRQRGLCPGPASIRVCWWCSFHTQLGPLNSDQERRLKKRLNWTDKVIGRSSPPTLPSLGPNIPTPSALSSCVDSLRATWPPCSRCAHAAPSLLSWGWWKISSFSEWKCYSLSHVWLFATPWTVCPWNSPGKIIGVACHSLVQGIFPTQESNPFLPHRNQILYHLSHQGSPRTFWVNPNVSASVRSLIFHQHYIYSLKIACMVFLCS